MAQNGINLMSINRMRAAIPGLAVRPVQRWLPTGHRAGGAGQGLRYTIQNESHFLENLCLSAVGLEGIKMR
jgi:hypothetical protein